MFTAHLYTKNVLAILIRAVIWVISLEGLFSTWVLYSQLRQNAGALELLYPGFSIHGLESYFLVLGSLYLLGILCMFAFKNRPLLLGLTLLFLFFGIGFLEEGARLIFSAKLYEAGPSSFAAEWMWTRHYLWAAYFFLTLILLLVWAPYAWAWYQQKYLRWPGRKQIELLLKILFSAGFGFSCIWGFINLYPNYLRVKSGLATLWKLCPDCTMLSISVIFILLGLLFLSGLYAALFPTENYEALPLTGIVWFIAVMILMSTVDFYIDPVGYNYEGSVRHAYWKHFLFDIGLGGVGIIAILAPKMKESYERRQKNYPARHLMKCRATDSFLRW